MFGLSRKKKNKTSFECICMVDTLYAMLLFQLLKPYTSDKKVFYIFSDGIYSKVGHHFDNGCFFKQPKQKKINLLYSTIKNVLLFEWVYFRHKLKDLPVYGQDHIYSAFLLLHKDNPFYLIEDGLANYTDLKFYSDKFDKSKLTKSFIKKMSNALYHPFPVLGLSERISRVYLTNMRDIPELYINKQIIFDPLQCWGKLIQKEKDNLSALFGFKANTFNQDFSDHILLLTAPLLETSNMNEKDVIMLYRKLLSKIDLSKLIIKTHPSETRIDYLQYFPNAIIWDKPFPIELLLYTGKNFKYIVSMFSSASFSIKDQSNVIISGTVLDPILIESYGYIDSNVLYKSLYESVKI